MGIDIESYRCRIRSFLSCRGACRMRMPCVMDFSNLVKFIGSLIFIGILLVMAGIEQNPGPADKFIFCYQYLLIEIGTKLLRRLFDVQVDDDLLKYLNANPAQSVKLQNLIETHRINASQASLLPPIDKKPTSSNFDITLLVCLLKNICGLRPSSDPVWMMPAPTDHSVEADIVRLRECRNNLMHSGTLLMSECAFADKWNELCHILNRLNTVCKIPNLPALIEDVKQKNLDAELKGRFIDIITQWHEMDRFIDIISIELKKLESKIQPVDEQLNQTGLKRGMSALTLGHDRIVSSNDACQSVPKKLEISDKIQETSGLSLKQCKPCSLEDGKDLKQWLIDLYQRDFSTIAVDPLFINTDVDLLSLYKFPTLYQVSYHVNHEKVTNKHIASYCDIFYDKDRSFRNIYITGDAGVGKSTLCKHMCLLWSKSPYGDVIESVKNDIDFLARFDFVFYLPLRDTERSDVIAIIVDQLRCTETDEDWEKMYMLVKDLLRQSYCLIILDGLDEWVPTINERNEPGLPSRVMYENCIYLTTSRPYKIENMRLTPNEIDCQIQITGLHGSASVSYVKGIVNYLNETNCDGKNPDDFLREVKQCGFEDQLCIPVIVSLFVVVWFEKRLTDMSRALIYGSVVDMLFHRAEKRQIKFPPSTSSGLQLPDSLSELCHLNKHASLLQKVCLLSFRSLFKQDENVATLIFTKEQLMSEPYLCTDQEIDFLCKIGILSINKVVGLFLTPKQKLSFLHKSFIEFFAALFVSSLDRNNCFDDIIKKWTSLNDVLQYQNFVLMLAGFSSQKISFLFENIYFRISDDLTLCRRNAIFHHDSESYSMQIKSLQDFVINCFEEVSRSHDPNIDLELEDFIFDDDSKVDILRQLLLSNSTFVKSISSVDGKYFDGFDQIKNLQCLHVGRVLPGKYKKFLECILQNKSTLHTVCIEDEDGIFHKPLIPELPVRRLQHLTSLSLSNVRMQHNSLHNLVKFLSDNVLIENIKLSCVYCDNHQDDDRDCTLTLNLPHHTKLTSLDLNGVNILCNKLNNSSLKSITLGTLSERIVSSYIDVFNCVKYSQLEHLLINGTFRWILDYNAMQTLVHTMKTLPYIKSLSLWNIRLPDDVLLQLHPDVTQVKIVLGLVAMSRQCFHCFIESIVNNRSVIKVELNVCDITSVDGETHRELSMKESMDYMSEYLTSIPTVNITHKDGCVLHFETQSCQ